MREVKINVDELVQDYKHARDAFNDRKHKTSASKHIYEGQMRAYAKVLNMIDPNLKVIA